MPGRKGMHASPLLRAWARTRIVLKGLHPSRRLVVGYLLWTLGGWGLLALPWSVERAVEGQDLLYLATASLATAGLAPFDVPATLTPFGEGVILLLVQVGGLGYMTIGSFATLALQDRIGGLRAGAIRAAFGLGASADVRLFLRSVILYTLACEAVGTLVLWRAFAAAGVEGAAWQALFHAVSAFCTAGMSMLPGGLEPFTGDVVVNVTLMALAMAGALGFLVVVDLWHVARGRAEALGFSSVVIVRVLPLLILGGALVLALEDPALRALPAGERAMASLFLSINASTTSGFSTIALTGLAPASTVVLVALMMIGSAPAGTGGGLRVTTFAALAGLVGDVLRQRDVVTIFGRRVGEERLRLAAATLCAYLGFAVLATLALTLTERGVTLDRAGFEVISLLSNVGLSNGLATTLSDAGEWVAILTMFAGRVGILTFGLALALKGADERGVEEELIL